MVFLLFKRFEARNSDFLRNRYILSTKLGEYCQSNIIFSIETFTKNIMDVWSDNIQEDHTTTELSRDGSKKVGDKENQLGSVITRFRPITINKQITLAFTMSL